MKNFKIAVFVNTKTSRIRNSFDSPELDFFVGKISYQLGTVGLTELEGHDVVEVSQEELQTIQKLVIPKLKADGTWAEGVTAKEKEAITAFRKANSLVPVGSISSPEDQITQLQLAVVGLMEQVEKLGGTVSIPRSAVQAELIIKEELDIRDIPTSEQKLVKATVEELTRR